MLFKNYFKKDIYKSFDINQFGNGYIMDIDMIQIIHIYEKIISINQNNFMLKCKHNNSYCCITEPDINFYDYVYRIIQYTKVSGWEICYGFVLLTKFIKYKRLNFENCMKYKLFLISSYIGHKFCSDLYYSIHYWSRCGGVKKSELIDMELEFLKVIDYRCFIKTSEIISLLVITEIIGSKSFNKEIIRNEKERKDTNNYEMPYTSLIKTFNNYNGSYELGFNSYENIEKLVKMCEINDDTNIYTI